MLTYRQSNYLDHLKEELKNLENALKNNKVEKDMILSVKIVIEKKKEIIRDIEQYK